MRDIDTIIESLVTAHVGIAVEQLKVVHPGADDDGLWFFRHPFSSVEVQLESSNGQCPFAFESDASPLATTAHTVTEAITLISNGLGVRAPSA